MAAYGALVSVMHTIDQIQCHPWPPISLDKSQVESLTENITFFQEFLQHYSLGSGYRNEADPLEMRIADAAYAAEDVIESHIVDQIHGESTSKIISCITFLFNSFPEGWKAPIHSYNFYQRLQKVIKNMDSLKKEAMEIKKKTGVPRSASGSSMPAGSFRYSSTGRNATMVGFDDVLVEILDKLTGGERDRQTIPIVGMGGKGKTTLAQNIYQHQVVVQHFDFRAWVTISQEYGMRECLLELLPKGGGDLSQMNEYELRDELHKRLSGRRYMIVLDDIWDIEVWDQLSRFFPDNKNGSRIVITTRISNFESIGSYVPKLKFLDEDNSWSLFSNVVFEEEGCPLELEKVGKKIVENCRGLPLSIVVVGGLLAKSTKTREYWEYIAENLNLIVNSRDDESCLKILHLSYNQLPVHLKPCFLYMGVFSEDAEIRVSTLIKLWVAEGILKPISGKTLEEVADEYLHELINRNLVLPHALGPIGNVKYCKIHDLLRDLCLREANKERFYHVVMQGSPTVPQDIGTQRRIIFPKHASSNEVHCALPLFSHARSLICDSDEAPTSLYNSRLLRIMSRPHYDCTDLEEDIFSQVNSRFLLSKFYRSFPSTFYPLWNLQTLIFAAVDHVPVHIWNMPQLRHIKVIHSISLADIPSGSVAGRGGIILENLQTLWAVDNFKCSDEVVKRIPNIKKLKAWYFHDEVPRDYCLHNFSHLRKLETFEFQDVGARGADHLQSLTFPNSLKKLCLNADKICWNDKLEQIGSLPFLEKLILVSGNFKEGQWETVEGQFLRLKFLRIIDCRLVHWITENSHFPCLEHLVLQSLILFEEIPSEIGEIPTLKTITLRLCSDSATISARKILEEQEELYGEVTIKVLIE